LGLFNAGKKIATLSQAVFILLWMANRTRELTGHRLFHSVAMYFQDSGLWDIFVTMYIREILELYPPFRQVVKFAQSHGIFEFGVAGHGGHGRLILQL
jgi:hypothetical protein